MVTHSALTWMEPVSLKIYTWRYAKNRFLTAIPALRNFVLEVTKDSVLGHWIQKLLFTLISILWLTFSWSQQCYSRTNLFTLLQVWNI
jgi:hypothetical protein